MITITYKTTGKLQSRMFVAAHLYVNHTRFFYTRAQSANAGSVPVYRGIRPLLMAVSTYGANTAIKEHAPIACQHVVCAIRTIATIAVSTG